MFLLAFAAPIQLFPDGTIFIHIALILIMIWVLNRTFFRPIYRVIAEREKFRGGHNVEAQEIAATASAKEAEYGQAIREARTKGYELIENERAEALAARQQLVGEARSEAEATLESGKQELQQQAAQVRAAIAGEAQQLAEKITSNILKG
jgi:F-type H+-transporting ATPase subunit b